MENVYLEKWRSVVGESSSILNYMTFSEREKLVIEYSWAVPDNRALGIIANLDLPIIEVGAGTGYWAKLLADHGVDIIAFDIEPPQQEDNKYRHKKQYTQVYKGDPSILSNYSDRALLLCWPPYDDDMAAQCLRSWNGSHLIYIGEDIGGCNANESFFQIIQEDFEILTQYTIPQWPGIHDELVVYKRKLRSSRV